MSKIPKLDMYIQACVRQTCHYEHRKNDVKIWYRVLDDEVVFAVHTQWPEIINRLLFRLNENLPKRFGLKLCLVMPENFDHGRYLEGTSFDLYPLENGVDPNYSICKWRINNRDYTIRSTIGIFEHRGTEHLEKLKEAGYHHLKDDHDWNKFLEAFKKVYGMTPLEANMAYRKRIKEKEN